MNPVALACGCTFDITDSGESPELKWERCAAHHGAVRLRLIDKTYSITKPQPRKADVANERRRRGL